MRIFQELRIKTLNVGMSITKYYTLIPDIFDRNTYTRAAIKLYKVETDVQSIL